MTGRKRHILVDTLGLLLVVVVHAADIQESEGAKLVLGRALGRFPRLRLIWADQGYKAHFVAWAAAATGWVVERTFAWLGRCRRLSKDYEALPETSEAWVHVAMVHLMLKRLAPT